MEDTSSAHCPRCGASLAQGSVDGLCAKCLGALNFVTDTVLPGEVAATMLHALGIDLETELPGLQGRPIRVVEHGVNPIHELF